jgi:hypothetical protein
MNEENVKKVCHKCGCTATDDNWLGGFSPDKMTCERCNRMPPRIIKSQKYNQEDGIIMDQSGSMKPAFEVSTRGLLVDTSGSMDQNVTRKAVVEAIADILSQDRLEDIMNVSGLMKSEPQIQILEPNVSKGIAYVRIGSQKPMYCMLNTDGVYFTPTIQELNNSQLRDILDHKVHMSRTHLRQNATCSFDWEDQEKNRLLTFDVYAYISPYVPARLYGPPEDCSPEEGGQIEDFYVVLNDAEFYDVKGDTVKTKANLTWRQVMDLELLFETELNKHSSCFNSVQELLFESGSSDDRDD